MVDIVTKLLLLLSPIAYGIRINLDKLDLRFFEIGVIALFIASLFDVPKRELNKDIKIFISTLLGLVIINSFWHKFQPLDIRAVEVLFFWILGFVLITQYLAMPKNCVKYIWWALGINILILIFQKIGYTPILSFTYYGSYIGCEGGLFGHIARFCIYMALILAFLPFYAALFLVIIFGLGLKYAQLSLLIPMFMMLYFRLKNFWERIILIIPIICIAILFHDKIWQSILMRWNVSWKTAIDMIFQQPLLGCGFGTYQLWTATESFNSYLPFIYGLGLLGVVWIGFVIRWFIKRFDASKEAIAVAGLLLVSLIEYSFEIPRLWFTIIAIISFFVIRVMEKEAINGDSKGNLQGT